LVRFRCLFFASVSTTHSLIDALGRAGIPADNQAFVQRLMDTVGVSCYEPKKAQEPYVIATRRDGLPNLRIYFGYTTGFTEEEAVRLAAAFGMETGKSNKMRGKWFVGHPINGGFGARGGRSDNKGRTADRCTKCRTWERSISGKCPECDLDD
jgi:hypothetical protein